MSDLTKATVIDGVAATQDRDNQNEILKLEGADISEMTSRGYFNDNHGTGFINTLGRITNAKKIMKQDDADDERQRQYWQKLQRPFLYVKGYLFDEEHPNAKSVSAIMKEFKKMGTPLDVQMSVEGKVIDRDRANGIIKESKIRNVALTLVPANPNTGSQVLSEDARQAILTKCQEDGANVDYATGLLKSLSDGITTPVMGFIELPPEEITIIDEMEPLKNASIPELEHFEEHLKRLNSMMKTLSAGTGGAGAPSAMAGGAAIASESVDSDVRSTTVDPKEAEKERKKQLLRKLLKKVRTGYPELSLEKAIEYSLEIFRTKIQ